MLGIVQQLDGFIQNGLEDPIIAMRLHFKMPKDPILRLQKAVVELTNIYIMNACYDSKRKSELTPVPT
jgi:hypothetical protein